MTKFIKLAAAVAAATMLAAPAHAAVLGGASLDLTNGTYRGERTLQGLSVTVSGDFFAQSLIEDFALQRSYTVSVFFEIDNDTLLDLTFGPSVFSINDLLALPPVQDGLDILQPLFGSNSGVLDVFGQSVSFDYAIADSDATSASGTFQLATLLTQNIPGVDLSGLNDQGSFTLSLSIVPVPLPATLPLLVGALGLLGWAARRRV